MSSDDYTATEEYQHEYYIAIKTKDGIIGKRLQTAKRLEINGIAFYTESSPLLSEDKIALTHGRTGVGGFTVKDIKEKFDHFMEKQKKYPDVESLPLVEWDPEKRDWVISDTKESEVEDNA